MLTIPPLEGLGWSKVRAIGRELAGSATPDEVAATALPLLGAPEAKRCMRCGFQEKVDNKQADEMQVSGQLTPVQGA